MSNDQGTSVRRLRASVDQHAMWRHQSMLRRVPARSEPEIHPVRIKPSLKTRLNSRGPSPNMSPKPQRHDPPWQPTILSTVLVVMNIVNPRIFFFGVHLLIAVLERIIDYTHDPVVGRCGTRRLDRLRRRLPAPLRVWLARGRRRKWQRTSRYRRG